jgi:para-nitrobenzyl esterase
MMPSFRTGRRRGLRTAAVVPVAVLALIVAAGPTASRHVPATNAGRAPVVATTGGWVQGKMAGSTEEYLGIPYAAPPVGDLRWQPPRPAAHWAGVREAASYAPHCPQPPSGFGVASTSENCLYLNVFAPAGRASRNLPVMVWLHGGSLLVGESDDYDPAALVRDGVVVVTVNYRLGALGFLADSALASRPGGATGDYGLQDQQAALRWVRRNIGHFGGDRGDVTLFGESAGGLSTLAQLVSPGARGLFQRAIVESGSYNLTQQPLATAEAAGATFAANVGCASNTAACLRALPASTIVDSEDFSGYTPDVDGSVLPQPVKTALASGQFSHVPVIIGTNHDEWRLFVAMAQLDGGPAVTPAGYQAAIGATLGVPSAAAAAIAAQYPLSDYPSPPVALGAVGTDAIFACPALTAEESLSRYTPVYAYEFNDENAPERYLAPVGFPYGAAHASEVQYLFELSDTAYPGPLTGPERELARFMKEHWTAFARTGAPGGQWAPSTSASQRTLSLVPPRPAIEGDYAGQHHCAFWAVAG